MTAGTGDEPSANKAAAADHLLTTSPIGDGQLVSLREMVRDQIRREGNHSSFAMRSGLLLAMIHELEQARAA